jgi:uncharacterized membrane protein
MGNEQTGKNIMKSVVLVMAVIILVLVSALIIGSLIGSTAFQTTLSGSVVNETLSAVDNVTNSTFAIRSTYSNAICNLASVVNATDGTVVSGAGNYTYYSSACNLIMQDGSPYIGSNLNASYTYTSVQNSIGGINTTWIGEQFGLFVTALLGFLAVIGVIIAIVWLIGYIKPLFSKDGIQSFGGN